MLTDREAIVMLEKIRRLAQALLISPYEQRHQSELAQAIREYEEAKRWQPAA